MTATATTEIDVLDVDAAFFRSRELGDLQLVEWDRAAVADVLSLDQVPHAQRDLVLVAIEDDQGGCAFPERVIKRTLTLPRAVLVGAGCDANIPACLVLNQDQPLVEVLLMVLDEVWSRLAAMSTWEVEATRGALVTLIAAVVRAESSASVTARSGLAALRVQIDEWVTRNLPSGPIRLEDLAVAHCVSARTIHRAFSLTGDTMKTVVRAKRLAAVREELVHTDKTIAAIAHRWSYYDPSHLGREFRRHFGVSPSEYRESHGC